MIFHNFPLVPITSPSFPHVFFSFPAASLHVVFHGQMITECLLALATLEVVLVSVRRQVLLQVLISGESFLAVATVETVHPQVALHVLFVPEACEQDFVAFMTLELN